MQLHKIFLGHALETSPEIQPMNGLQLMSSILYIKIVFWQNLFLTLLNATTAYTVTSSSLWHYAELTCCTCTGLHKVPISSTALLYFTYPWRAVVVDYSSLFVNVVRTMKSRVVADHVLWCHCYNHWKTLDFVLDLNYFSFSNSNPNPNQTHLPQN